MKKTCFDCTNARLVNPDNPKSEGTCRWPKEWKYIKATDVACEHIYQPSYATTSGQPEGA